MNALIEHINAIQKLQMTAVICFECRKLFARCRIIVKGSIYTRILIHFMKPLTGLILHLIHMFLAGTKKNVFAAFL